ncbi:unnamed protein product [Trichobilharzia regenti]|nr:unnamed protein product [Trichobilharzia regenti]
MRSDLRNVHRNEHVLMNRAGYTPVDCIKSALQDTSSHLLIRAIQLACKLTILKGDGGQLENSDTDCCTDYETSFNFEPKQLIQLLLYHFNLSGNKKEEKGSMEMLWYLHDKDIPISDLKVSVNHFSVYITIYIYISIVGL